MLKLLILYAHLLATCGALGTIAMSDAKLLLRFGAYKARVPPPSGIETGLIAATLGVLLVTGAGLVALALQANPNALADPKLQGKLLLIVALVLNAFVLHRRVFPWLSRAIPVGEWGVSHTFLVCLSVGLSTSLWLYCAFLGIARSWSFNVSHEQVLIPATLFWIGCSAGVRGVLVLAAREEPRAKPDLIDAVKRALIRLDGLGAPRRDERRSSVD